MVLYYMVNGNNNAALFTTNIISCPTAAVVIAASNLLYSSIDIDSWLRLEYYYSLPRICVLVQTFLPLIDGGWFTYFVFLYCAD